MEQDTQLGIENEEECLRSTPLLGYPSNWIYMHYPLPLKKLIEQLKKLPGVGRKSAERFAFKLIDWSPNQIQEFSHSLLNISQSLGKCPDCGAIQDEKGCLFCLAPKRTRNQVCLVASSKDIFAIEETGIYSGLYYVIESLFSPLENLGASNINLIRLKRFLKEKEVQELVIALDSTVEGDATTLFLKRELKELPLKISRLAFGVPVGSALDYVDGHTLSQALMGRHLVS